jgi:hypothetical protein
MGLDALDAQLPGERWAEEEVPGVAGGAVVVAPVGVVEAEADDGFFAGRAFVALLKLALADAECDEFLSDGEGAELVGGHDESGEGTVEGEGFFVADPEAVAGEAEGALSIVPDIDDELGPGDGVVVVLAVVGEVAAVGDRGGRGVKRLPDSVRMPIQKRGWTVRRASHCSRWRAMAASAAARERRETWR